MPAGSAERVIARNCPGNISADAVGGLAQYTESRVGNLREMLCQRMNIRILRMMLRQVAKKNCRRLIIDEAGCYRTARYR